MLRAFILIVFFGLSSICVSAQTSAFTYQGRLTDNGTQRTATYDMEFRLFDALEGGNQLPLGNPITITFTDPPRGVSVANGAFTVQLDFGGAAAFDGNPRWLQIAVKKPTDSSFVPLNPRQPITSMPYAIKALNAASADTATNSTQLGGVAASQYVVTTDPRMTDARSPVAGSDNYIQNRTTSQPAQPANFNISGDGTLGRTLNAGTVNATEYDSEGTRIVGAPGTYLLLGKNVSAPAGLTNATAIGNQARVFSSNSLILGSNPDFSNPTLPETNVGIGLVTPEAKLDVVGKVVIRRLINALPGGALFGNLNVINNGSGDANLYMASGPRGINFGVNSQTAANATLLISHYDGTALTPRFAIGQDGNVGIGTTSPEQTLHVNGLGVLSTGSGAGFRFRDRSSNSANDDWVWYSTGNVARFRRANDPNPGDLFTISTTGVVQLFGLGTAGGVPLCFNPFNQISLCSSSIRYKNNINNFSSGLELIRRLRPVSFNWKANNQADMGLVAEEVADVEPLLVTHNNKGEIEGVKYDRVGVVLINAVKEQQGQIEDQRTLIQSQQELLETQQRQIDALKKLVCSMKASADICKKEQ